MTLSFPGYLLRSMLFLKYKFSVRFKTLGKIEIERKREREKERKREERKREEQEINKSENCVRSSEQKIKTVGTTHAKKGKKLQKSS